MFLDQPGLPLDLGVDVRRPRVRHELIAAEHVRLPVAPGERRVHALAVRDRVARAPPVVGGRELSPQADVVVVATLEQVGVPVDAVEDGVEAGAEVVGNGAEGPRLHRGLLDDIALQGAEPAPSGLVLDEHRTVFEESASRPAQANVVVGAIQVGRDDVAAVTREQVDGAPVGHGGVDPVERNCQVREPRLCAQ